MTNFGAKILNNAVSSLRAQQAVIANTGNNISNVNTPGYTRRTVNLYTGDSRQDAGGVNVGSGVRIGNTVRVADSFLQNLVFDASAEKTSNEVQNEFLTRIEKLFSLKGDISTIGSSLTKFFTAINDLSANPSSIELRTNVLERAQDLVTAIKTAYNSLASLQDEANDRIGTEIQTVNALTTQIAELNGRITQVEAGNTGMVAADERDQRDKLLQDLSEKISFSQIELSDGSVTLTLPNGFALVNGTNSRNLTVTSDPSFTTGRPPSLSGGVLSYIVYDYSGGSGTSQADMTQALKAGNGTIAGYLNVRGYADPNNTSPFQADGTIPQIASRIEAITRALLTDFNQTYLGYPTNADRNAATAAYDSSAVDLDSAAPQVFGFFSFPGAADQNLGVLGVDGLPTVNYLNNLTNIGDVQNFSSILTLNISNPRNIAAGWDTTSLFPAPLKVATADGRNLQGLAALQDKSLSMGAGAFTGSFQLTASLGEGYNQLVGYVGNLKAASDIASTVSLDNFNTILDRRDAVSAVSLDEEFSRLISFQKAYQAAARMIKVADELLQQVVELI